MIDTDTKLRIGTSGWSFDDWVGRFYSAETTKRDMFARYVQHFRTVEVNYTYYRMPAARTFASLSSKSPPGFDFWVKANQDITHRQQTDPIAPFCDALSPLLQDKQLAGVLLQFPQGFHRTVANRRFLATALAGFAERLGLPSASLAVEFRHASWDHPDTTAGLTDRGHTLVIPDVPDIAALYRVAPQATSEIGYLRLHSRNAGTWYAGAAERYDYHYDTGELRRIAEQWQTTAAGLEKVYVLFNNCHHAQAANNAQDFRCVVEELA
ncbi:MAG: DUF72 domain-containing protein [Planctomycetes bacterium]|jgi:uncharacterized protein YecE (DUF72 family)|nr:DUF72 domain-containing protein [Phycisphaerae bacterium]NBB95211.1 DUF72 domain-containing protein [Planctomycetota bacterium]